MLEYFVAGGLALAGVTISTRAAWPVFAPKIRGFFGENKVKRILNNFRGSNYAKAHDILLPGGRDTTQIDHVLVSRHGIFVIETKNYSGRIYGSLGQEKWFQSFPGGSGREFMNPLQQNKTHVKAIRSLLRKYPNIPYYSIVAFSDKCDIPQAIPNVVKIGNLKLAIEARCNGKEVLSQEQVQDINTILKESNIKNRSARELHDTKAMLAAEGSKHKAESMAKFQERAKDSPTLYFGEKTNQPQRSTQQTALTDAGAMLNIRGRRGSIEEIFESAKRDANGHPVPKGADFDHFICPYTDKKFPKEEAKNLYQGLWVSYLKRNPNLVQYLHDHISERPGGTFRCQKVLAEYERDPNAFIAKAKETAWYKNIFQSQSASQSSPQQQNHLCRPLNEQIYHASNKHIENKPTKETANTLAR